MPVRGTTCLSTPCLGKGHDPPNSTIAPSMRKLPMDVMNNPDKLSVVTVTASRPLIRPDGRYAIELATAELGSIAFEVDELALFALRQAIGEIETEMNRRPGRA